MTPSEPTKGILHVSTFPPVKCGIASFTQDLTNAIGAETAEKFSLRICALNRENVSVEYEDSVVMTMDGHQLGSCVETAGIINQDPTIDLVCIEHEFGLYGGEFGEYLLNFVELLEKPFVLRFHTMLPHPEPKRLKVVQKIASLAERVIVMTGNSARLLNEHYEVSPEKIVTIPHGTHPNSTISPNELKLKYDLEGKRVLTTFGLLSPNKGIEKAIIAMKEISAAVPDAMYIVLGLTHPNLVKQEGEKYRDFLQKLIDDNELQNNVRLVNEYIPTDVLMEYLALTDVYLFTSKDPNQAVSGTFLYAMSAGCPIISNSFAMADELLDDKTGITLSSDSEHELAEGAIRLLQNDSLRKQMRENALVRTQDTKWNMVAMSHIDLFDEILARPVHAPQSEIY